MDEKKTSKKFKEPIAIVGIGCRFPGKINDSDSFWRLLTEERHGITEVPASRWDKDKYYDPDPDAVGKLTSKYGGFVSFVDQFDARFFKVGPREATRMDPQQRIALQTTFEALEDAGFDKISQKNVGVFVGVQASDYQEILYRDLSAFDMTSAVGSTINSTAARISYFFDFKGPSLVVDTDRSSSLAAIHFGCLSIDSGDCEVSICGGTNLVLSPLRSIPFSNSGLLAPDGRCKFGSANANGITRSDGIGFVVLKPLSQALADNDRIYSLIVGSSIRHCGAESGDFIRPSQKGQEDTIRSALTMAGVSPVQINFVEAHGTGTPIGDQVELAALGDIFGQSRIANCLIGSVKTNLGHTEAAGGVASVIKASLALTYRKFPKSLFADKLHTAIDFDKLKLKIAQKLEPLPEKGPLFAGVSSFGLTGTNVHIVLENFENQKNNANAKSAPITSGPANSLFLTAHSESCLGELIEKYSERLQSGWSPDLSDMCYTAACRRQFHQFRAGMVFNTRQELKELLDAALNGESRANLIKGAKDIQRTQVVFVFPGQGSQYSNMGKRLYESNLVFKSHIDQCAEILKLYMDKSLIDILFSDSEDLNSTKYTQPAIFSVEYALAKTLETFAITPDFMMGHSVGEYVAAHLAGVFSLEDALKLVATRAKLMFDLCETGSMFAIGAKADDVSEMLVTNKIDLSIAAINGPENIVVAGRSSEVEKFSSVSKEKGFAGRKLAVSHAFHSPLVAPMLKDFEAVVRSVKLETPTVRVISNLVGKEVSEELCDPLYWVNHISHPVRFWDSLTTLSEKLPEVILEIGARPTLSSEISEMISQRAINCTYSSTLDPKLSDDIALLRTLTNLFVSGYELDLRNYYSKEQVISLPNFPWDRTGFWYGRNDSILKPSKDLPHPVVEVHPALNMNSPSRPQELPAIDPSEVNPDKKFGKRITDKLLMVPQQKHESILAHYLTTSINILMEQKPTEKIDLNIDLKSIGFNSILSVKLRNQLGRDFNRAFNVGLVFNYPSLAKLSKYLAEDFDKNKSKYTNAILDMKKTS